MLIQILGEEYHLETHTRPMIITDNAGNEYRIRVLEEGLSINKTEGAISITPKVSNEIEVK